MNNVLPLRKKEKNNNKWAFLHFQVHDLPHTSTHIKLGLERIHQTEHQCLALTQLLLIGAILQEGEPLQHGPEEDT